jgi:predicted DNA-binding ribbon-helix-helix protein
MWEAFRDIAEREQCSINKLATDINAERGEETLTTAIRVYIVRYYRSETIRAEQRLKAQSFSR